MAIVLDGSGLTVEKLVQIARHNEKVELHTEAVERINNCRKMLEKKIDAAGAAKVLDAFRSIDAVLGFLEFDKEDEGLMVQELINARNQARSEHKWELADRIRNQLRAQGINVQDEKL